MGIISILLGIITFLGMTGAGAWLSNFLLEQKATDGVYGSIIRNVNNTTVVIVIVGLFAFIGLLICMNLVMAGLNYNKLRKLQKAVKRRI